MKIFSCIIVLLLGCSFALAHSCATYRNLPDKEHSKKLQEIDYIFEGEKISIINLDETSALITYKVSRVWKGNITSEITVKFDNFCGTISQKTYPTGEVIKISKGEKELVYGYSMNNQQYVNVNCCNFGLFDNARMKLEYGEGIAVEKPAQEAECTLQQNTNNEGYWSLLWKKIGSFFS
jgi:hypothetical protein